MLFTRSFYKWRSTVHYILKPVWFLAFQKTKSWLQLSPDKKRRGLSPDKKRRGLLLGQNSFWILSENYFEMSINRETAPVNE